MCSIELVNYSVFHVCVCVRDLNWLYLGSFSGIVSLLFLIVLCENFIPSSFVRASGIPVDFIQLGAFLIKDV